MTIRPTKVSVADPAEAIPAPTPASREFTTTKYSADPAINTVIKAVEGIEHLTPAQQEQAYQRLSQRYSKQG
jgi:hypothetical protein